MRSCRALSASASIRQLSTATATHGAPSGLCGPAVRFLLIQYGLDGKDVKATGPKHNILKSDVLQFIEKSQLKPVPISASSHGQNIPESSVGRAVGKTTLHPTPTIVKGSARNVEKYVDIPLTNIRRTIAKRLSQSKQTIPHEYSSASIQADALTALRRKLKEDGIVLSLNDFIIKATALALRAVPEMNVKWVESNGAGQAVPLDSVDISVAVATPTGLITPIVFGADVLGVRTLSHKVKELAIRAKENKLQPNEFQGGSFTISNLGMFGSVDNFTAIINPPQAAILTVGGSKTEINEQLKPETKFTVTVCYDGRAISASSAQLFLRHVSASLSDPDFMVAEPLDPALDFDFARLL